MGAFNYVLIEANCPQCGEQSSIRCQVHVASDFSGDATGRFCHRNYLLGERMAWWEETDARYRAWIQDEQECADGAVVEACYSKCIRCEADLCVILRFEHCTPVAVLGVSLESNWPDDYAR